MPIKSSHSDPIAAAKRRSVATRRVGVGNACACGEDRPNALIAGTNPVICEECRRREKRHRIYDNHHIAGIANHCLTIPILTNDHKADLSEKQRLWPKAILENRDGSPLLSVAGCNLGVVDTIPYLVEGLLLGNTDFLGKLDAFLAVQFGPKWWEKKEFVEFDEQEPSA
jgi:hypothetical protein